MKYINLYLFRSVPGVFGNQQANYLDLIKQMLQQSVLDGTNYEVSYNLPCLFLICFNGRWIHGFWQDKIARHVILPRKKNVPSDDCNL